MKRHTGIRTVARRPPIGLSPSVMSPPCERASFNAEFLRSVWVVGIPALAGALAVSYLVSSRWAERAWTSWLLIMPIGGLAILGYSLTTYFTR